MARIGLPAPDDMATGSKAIVDAVSARLGFVPNLHRLLANSPTALSGVNALQRVMSDALDAETRTAIALAVSEVNACSYCLSSHCYVAQRFNETSEEEVLRNRLGRSADSKREAAARFAAKVVDTRGHVDDTEFDPAFET